MDAAAQVLPNAQWPYQEILVRLGLSLALGLLIGLEREWRGKEAGVRTFGFICLLGALGGSLGTAYALVILGLVGLLAVLLNVQSLRADGDTELTTSAAMLLTCVAGILCGLGHTAAPAAVIVLATALLAWKERMAGFSSALTETELRSALLLAILAIVIYPALPEGAVGPWKLIEPRAAWLAVILIAAIGFVNYVLWKMYGTRGTELAGFLGGLVNSNVTVIELSSRVRQATAAFADAAYRGIMLATTAMVARNVALLLILAPLALVAALVPFVLMLATSAGLALWSYRRRERKGANGASQEIRLPFSLPVALKYGIAFLVLNVLGEIAGRHFGHLGFYFISAVGGLLSSASAVAAAATLSSRGTLPPDVAGTGAVLASLTSIAFSLSLVLRSRDRVLIRRLAYAMAGISVAGLIGTQAWGPIRPALEHWIVKLGEAL